METCREVREKVCEHRLHTHFTFSCFRKKKPKAFLFYHSNNNSFPFEVYVRLTGAAYQSEKRTQREYVWELHFFFCLHQSHSLAWRLNKRVAFFQQSLGVWLSETAISKKKLQLGARRGKLHSTERDGESSSNKYERKHNRESLNSSDNETSGFACVRLIHNDEEFFTEK